MKRQKTHLFTLLELMVGIFILCMAAGVLGWKLNAMMEKSRFQTDAKKVQSRLFACHRLSLNTQADWRVTFEKKGKKWRLTTTCIDEPKMAVLPPLTLHRFSLFFNRKPLDQMGIDFTSTGEVFPRGELSLSENSFEQKWMLPEMFQKESGKKTGPLHPKMLLKN